MRWVPQVVVLSPETPRLSHLMTSCGSMVSHLASLSLSVFICHMGILPFMWGFGGVPGPVAAHSRPTANLVNGCQWLHRSQRPPGNEWKANNGGRKQQGKDDRLLASPLGVVADFCGGLRPPQSHRVAAGSTPSPTKHHTKRPLFLAQSIYPWPIGCTALSLP